MMATTYLTPGVYFERPQRPVRPLWRRTDVAGFAGLAERGPLHQPQRLTSWRQFQEIFGGFLAYAYLAYAVHAFFANGGRVCWVVRVAALTSAVAATVALPGPTPTDPVVYQVQAITAGTWGNQLAVSVQRASLGATQHVAIAGLPTHQLAVANTVGFEVGSLIRLTQMLKRTPVQVLRRINRVDPVRGLLELEADLPSEGPIHTDPAVAAISVESLEFSLLVWQADQVAERFERLAPDPDHRRNAMTVVNANSRLIRLQQGAGVGLPQLPWRSNLQGGANGLQDLTVSDYIGTPQGDAYGLAALAPVDEVSLLAMPDLTLKPQVPEGLSRAPRRPVNPCALDRSDPPVVVRGQVLDARTQQPLPGVNIDDGLQRPSPVNTDAEGRFALDEVWPGPYDLVLNHRGYEPRSYAFTVAATPTGEQELAPIRLTPLDVPPALTEADIAVAQRAMVAQCEQLRDRVALLDPPLDAQGQPLNIMGLQAWRARFDSAFAVLYYPWLVIRDPRQPQASTGQLIPPSGHVAGRYAATDLTAGVFRPPANQPLAFVEDVAVAIDDALQGVLNPQGINVIRAFPGRGIRIYGARTLSSDSAWRFITVRRLISLLEAVMFDGLQWAVFEPNTEPLWFGIRLFLTTLLDHLWRRGAFVGDTAEAAYQVRCDAVTTPPEVQAVGQVIAEVSVAPTVPYEFIVIRLGLTADELQISEVSP